MPDPVDRPPNSENKEQIAKVARRTKASEVQKLRDLEAVMKTPEGRRVIKRIIDMSGVHDAKWGNEAAVQYAAGKSYIGVVLIQDLEKLDPASFVTMLTEDRIQKRG